jgi:dimethylaniline monooxygenase (N-oxide forming)
LPTHWDISLVAKFFHFLAMPLKWLWWRIVELMFRFQFRLTGDLVPSSRIEVDLFNGGQILSYEFRDMLRKGEVGALQGAISRFTASGVELSDGTALDADIVVFGTGFTKSYAYLEPMIQANLNRQRDGLYLYRNIFPTQVRDLCFIGAETSTFNNILTQGLQALWLRQVLSRKLELPSIVDMDATVAREQEWKQSWMPGKGDRAAILQLHKMKYHDQLCRDMGVNHRRKGCNLLAEVFAPYTATDYSELFVGEVERRGFALILIISVVLATFSWTVTGSTKVSTIVGLLSLVAPTLVDVISCMLQALVQRTSQTGKSNSLTVSLLG